MATEYPFTKQSFVKRVREKAQGDYADWDDDKLFSAVTNKYPEYIDKIDPASMAAPVPAQPSLMGKLFDAVKGMFGGGGNAPLPADATPAPKPVVPVPAPNPVPNTLDAETVRDLAGRITDTAENIQKVRLAQEVKNRTDTEAAGGLEAWLTARKDERKFGGVVKIDPAAALEIGAARADAAANVAENAVAGEVGTQLKNEPQPPELSQWDGRESHRAKLERMIGEQSAQQANDTRKAIEYAGYDKDPIARALIGAYSGTVKPFFDLGSSIRARQELNTALNDQNANLLTDSELRDNADLIAAGSHAGESILEPPRTLGQHAADLVGTALSYIGGGPKGEMAKIGGEVAERAFANLAGDTMRGRFIDKLAAGAAHGTGAAVASEAVTPPPVGLNDTAGDIVSKKAQEMAGAIEGFVPFSVGGRTAAALLHKVFYAQTKWTPEEFQTKFPEIVDRVKNGTATPHEEDIIKSVAMYWVNRGEQIPAGVESDLMASRRAAQDALKRTVSGDLGMELESIRRRRGLEAVGDLFPTVKGMFPETVKVGIRPEGELGAPKQELGTDKTDATAPVENVAPPQLPSPRKPEIVVPGENGEFADPNDPALLNYLARAIPARMVAGMSGETRLRLGNDPAALQALSSTVLADRVGVGAGETDAKVPMATPPAPAPVVTPKAAPVPTVPVPAPAPPVVAGNGVPVPVTAAFRVKSPLRRDVQAQGHFDVVELDNLFQGPQDRNRTRAASNAQTEQVYQNFDEEELGHSVTSDRGAPIIMPDGRILAGHGRRNVMIRVYGVGGEKAARYRGFVENQAAAMGLGDKAKGMKEPVLVRVVDKIDNATPEQFAELSNQKQMLGYSDAEKAVKDARRLLSGNMIQSLNVTDPDNLLAAGNRDFIGAFLDKQDDAAEYWTADGQAAPALEGRIQRAVLSALVLGDSKAGGESDAAHTVAILVEKASDYGVTPMLKGLTAAAPRLLKIRTAKPEWDLTASLSRVMPEIVRAKEAVQSGKFRKIEDYFQQSDWTRKASPEDLEMATLLLNAKSGKQVSELLDQFTKVAENHDSKTVDMFGGVLPESTKLDVLRRLNNGQNWTTISVEPDRTDNGVGGGGSVRGEEPQGVGAPAGPGGSGGAVDRGAGEAENRSAQPGGETAGSGRYQAVIQNDIDDLDKLYGTGDGHGQVKESGGKYGNRERSGLNEQDSRPVDRRDDVRSARWDSAIRQIQGLYGLGTETTPQKSPLTGVQDSRDFGSSYTFRDCESIVAKYAPAGTRIVPVRDLTSPAICFGDFGVILLDETAPNPVRTIRHEIFHLLGNHPTSAPIIRRMESLFNLSSQAAKTYLAARNSWRKARGLLELTQNDWVNEMTADLAIDWRAKTGHGGKTYWLNSAISPENAQEFQDRAKQLEHSQRQNETDDLWGGAVKETPELFSIPSSPSKIEVELGRIAKTRKIETPAAWDDFEALATKALQSKADRLAADVQDGRKTPEAARKEWEQAQADIEARRAKMRRRNESLRAEANERAQGKLLDVPSTGGMLLESGEPYGNAQASEDLAKANGLTGDEAAKKAETLAGQLDFLSGLSGAPEYGAATGGEARPVSRRPGVEYKSVLANRKAIAEAFLSKDPGLFKALFDKGIPVSTIIPELARGKTGIRWDVRGFVVKTPEDAAALFIGLRNPLFEQFSVLYLDSRNAVIEGRIVSVGILDSSLVHPRDVFGDAPEGTVAVVPGHNHPSEDHTPSEEDVRLTRQLVQAGKIAGISVLDHVITNGKHFSMRESGLVDFGSQSGEFKPRVIPKKEMRGRPSIEHPFIALEKEPDWNVVPRNDLPFIRTPGDLNDFAKRFRSEAKDYFHVVGLNTRNRTQMIWRFPMTDNAYEVSKVVARQSGKYGVASVVIDFPEVPGKNHVSMFKALTQAFNVLGVKLLDVIHAANETPSARPYVSMRESGSMKFEEEAGKYGGVKDDIPPWWDTIPGIIRREGVVDFGTRGKTHEESFGMNTWGFKFHYSPKDGKVIWWEDPGEEVSNSVRDAIENRGWKYAGNTDFLKWNPTTATEYVLMKGGPQSVRESAGGYGADTLDKVAKVLVGSHDGKVPTREQAEAWLKSKGWFEKLSGRLDEILKKAETIAGTKELDYALGIKTGKLGSDGEAGRQSGGGSERGTPGSGQALAGTTGGESPRRRTDIRIAGAENLPEPPNYVPADSDADADQRLGVNLILHRFATGGRGFLLADGTGMGKTTQILLAADLFRKMNPGSRVLIVTQNVAVIKGSFYSDSKRMGIGINQFDLATYDGIKAGKAHKNLRMENGKVVSDKADIDPTKRYDLVIFDEAHNLKNLESNKTSVSAAFAEKAKHVVFATATPMDRPTGSVYFLSQVTGITPDKIGAMLGFEWKKVRNPETGETKDVIVKKQGMSWADVLANLANMRNEAVRQGSMIRREYPLMAHLSQEEIPVSQSDLDFDRRIVAYYSGLAAHYPPYSIAAKNFKGQATHASHHFGESLKIQAAIDKAMESIKSARKPIIVASKVDSSERLSAPPEMVEDSRGRPKPNWKYQLWIETIGTERTIPAVAKGIVAGLKANGIKVAEVFGAGDKAGEIARFQGGQVDAVVMTAASGGAGVNLDDVIGDKPRDMIVITPIFAGDMFQQVLGRISRRNTASWGRVMFLNASGTYGDSKARAIQKAKIELMTRIQQGADIDIAGFDKDAGLPMAAGGREELPMESDDEPLAELSAGSSMAKPMLDQGAQGEDLPGNKGGVWETRPVPGLPEPTTGRAVINLPSLVRLYKDLMGGAVPIVRKRIRILGGTALGAFYPKSGKIELLASIFDPVSDTRKSELMQQARQEIGKPNSTEEVNRYRELLQAEYAKPESQEPRQALATLAHEIGHAYDWLPDRNMSKGNILGRIAAIHGYMNDMLGKLPEFQDLITEEERQAARADAAKRARAQIPPVKGANESQRKARETAVNALTAKFYSEDLAREAKRRGLITRDEITKELKALTQWWKPFDDRLDPHFTEYRYSAPELLADSISVMMNRPDALRRIAPTFEKSLFGWMGERPEFQRAWDDVQAELIGGEADKRLVADILRGFHDAEESTRGQLDNMRTGWRTVVTAIRFALIDTADPILRKVREFGEAELDALKNPRYAIEDAIYVGSVHEAYLKHLNREVLEPLSAAGVSTDLMGVYALSKRVLDERGTLANPFGIDPAAAKRLIEHLRDTKGEEGIAALETAWKSFWDLRKRFVLDDIEKGGAWSHDLLDKARDNEAYATFDIVDYLAKRYGSTVGPRVFRQVGTLKAVKNPFTATIQKDLSLISANLRNDARRVFIDFMKEAYPGEIEVAQKRWNGHSQECQLPNDPNQDLVGYMKDGKFEGYYVDKWMAAHFAHEDPAWLKTVGSVMAATMKPFRFVFTDANPGFWAMNIFRDYHATIAHLPGAWSPVGTYTVEWVKGVREGFKSVFGMPSDVVEDMLKGKMLISMISNRLEATEDDTILDRLLVQVQRKKLDWHALSHPAEAASTALDYWTGIGKAFERSNQIAAYTWLKKYHPEMHEKEIAHLVRTVASPAFLRKGAAYPVYNNLFMFSNANKEGLRAEAEAFRRGKAAWAFKTTAYVLIPRLITWGIQAGLLAGAAQKIASWFSPDDDKESPLKKATSLQEMYSLIPEYDLANYLCVPVGMTESGKVVYLRFPQMENARMIGGVFWKMLKTAEGKEMGRNILSDLFSFAGGQVPRLNPAIGLGLTVSDLMMGQNPVDTFTGQPMMPKTVFDAQDSRTVSAAAKGLWNNAGGGILIRFKNEDTRSIQTTLEKTLGLPGMGNIANRFIKVSDRGLWEDVQRIKRDETRQSARERLDVAEMAAGERPWDESALRHKETVKDLLTMKALRDLRGDSTMVDPSAIRNLQILQGASGNEEKAKLVEMLRGRGLLKR